MNIDYISLLDDALMNGHLNDVDSILLTYTNGDTNSKRLLIGMTNTYRYIQDRQYHMIPVETMIYIYRNKYMELPSLLIDILDDTPVDDSYVPSMEDIYLTILYDSYNRWISYKDKVPIQSIWYNIPTTDGRVWDSIVST